MMKYKDGGIFQDRDGMKAPQDIDGGSAKPKKPKKKPSRTKLPPLRPGQIDMPSDPDDGSVGLKHGGNVKGMHRMPDGKMMKNSAHDDMKHGGKVKGMHRMPDGKMMKNSAHDDMKKDAPMMKKVAAKAVKGHEKRMHKSMASGGSVRGDGCAQRGKTKGAMR
jgi:hypothetical protein